MITWNITPAVSQYNNSPVRVAIQGLAPLEKLTIIVSTPCDAPFRWQVQADAAGNLVAELFLASGSGRYLFEVEGCKDLPPVSVVANCCAPGVEGCKLELFATPATLQLNGRVAIDVTGAASGSTVHIQHQLPSGVLVAHSAKTSTAGLATLELELPEPGAHRFFAMQDSCAAESKKVTVIGNVNELATRTVNSCVGAVRVTPKLSQASAATGEVVALTISVTNSGIFTHEVSFEIGMPSEFTTTTAVAITNEPIAAGTTRDFIFYLTVVGLRENKQIAAIVVDSSMGTYICNEQPEVIIGGSASIELLPTSYPCGLEIVRFGFNLSSVGNGQAAIVALTIRNTGLATLRNITLVPTLPPASLGTEPLQFSGVELAPGMEYTYSKALSAVSAANITAVLTIPASSLTAICQSNPIQARRQATASILVRP